MENIKIFLSYSRNGKEIANKFNDYFTEKGFDILWEENFSIWGQNFNQAIKRALTEADIILPIITEEFQSSKYAQSEFQTSIGYCSADDQKRYFPI